MEEATDSFGPVEKAKQPADAKHPGHTEDVEGDVDVDLVGFQDEF